MKIYLAQDNTSNLNLNLLAEYLNVKFGEPRVESIQTKLHFNSLEISTPESQNFVIQKLGTKAGEANSVTFVFTAIQYDNNFFYEDHENVMICSFSNWNILSSLPLTNAAIYAICSYLGEMISPDDWHDQNVGCLNDYLWDKTGIDTCMRAASYCPACRANLPQNNETESLLKILDDLSIASRRNQDILEQFQLNHNSNKIEVFLCHNSLEKGAIRDLNAALKSQTIKTWLDEDDLDPGSNWLTEIQEMIPTIQNAMVCVGVDGLGPWQRSEIDGLIVSMKDKGVRIIPTILPSATKTPELPLFLRNLTWLDLRTDYQRKVGQIKSLVMRQRNGI